MIDATIAITNEGASNSNFLRVAEWQLTEFFVKASGKRSKCYRPEGAPTSPTANEGVDDINFAPEYEVIELHYVISDPNALIKGGILEVFSRFNSKALWSLDLEKLGPDWLKHGTHVVKWDGRVISGGSDIAGTVSGQKIEHDLSTEEADTSIDPDIFPDGFITLENTPFKLKLTLTPKDAKNVGNPATSWTFLHLLIEKLEIVLADEEWIPAATIDDDRHKMDKALRTAIVAAGGAPVSGAQRRVPLISNLFKTSSAEMNDNTAFDEYKTLWGNGAKIPLQAHVYILDSGGNGLKLADQVKGAVALGNVKFLWDWEDQAENVAAQQNSPAPLNALPLTYINAAIDYYRSGVDPTRAADDHTYPQGDNCHLDRGGKRGPGADAVFPDQAGYAAKATLDVGVFPFKVEPCVERKWASFSYGWREGKLKGTSGVLFEPCRMAGDDYVVSVYLAYDISAKDTWVLDDKAEPLSSPPNIKASSGAWQMWRELHIARYIRKQAGIAAFVPANIPAIEAIYDDAFVDVVDKMTADDSYLVIDHRKADGTALAYNALAIAKINAIANPLFTNDLVLDRAANHAGVDSGLETRSYADFVQALHAFLHAATPAAAGDIATIATANGMTPVALSNVLATAAFGAPPHGPDITRLLATQAWLNTNLLRSIAEYSNYLDGVCFDVISQMVEDGAAFGAIAGAKNGQAPGAEKGVTIVHFDFSNSYLKTLVAAATPGVGYINGAAIDTSDADRNHCAFIFTNAMLDTFCHEIGHHMFLPHARFSRPGRPPPGGAKPDRHDDLDANCMMSYNRPRHAFCGQCQLRLRGWDATALDKILANNRKP